MGYPPGVNRQMPVKTVPSHRTTYAGTKDGYHNKTTAEMKINNCRQPYLQIKLTFLNLRYEHCETKPIFSHVNVQHV